jgi:hypothetical protein
LTQKTADSAAGEIAEKKKTKGEQDRLTQPIR